MATSSNDPPPTDPSLMDSPAIDDPIDQLQAEHLAAQTARLQAQEAAIRDRLETPWYERAAALNLTKAIAQGLFTVIIGLPIVWFYVEQVIRPSTQADNLKLEIELLTERRNLNEQINELETSLQQSQSAIANYQKELESTQQELSKTKAQIAQSESSVQQITTELKQQPNLPSSVIEQVETVSSELEQTNQAIVNLQATVTTQEAEAVKVQEEISKNLETKVQSTETESPTSP